MERFNVEEVNLIAIYIGDIRARLIEDMTTALPDMDTEMRTLTERTLVKLRAMSDAEFMAQGFSPAYE